MRRGNGKFDVMFYAPWIGPLLRPGVDAPPGGAETQILMLARGLVRRGHKVRIVAFDTQEGLPANLDGIEISLLPKWRSGRRLFRGVAFASWVLVLLRALAPLRTRVIVQRAAGMETGVVALIARILGERFVYSSANVIDFDYARLEKSRVNVRLFHLGVRLAHTVIVQNDEQVAMCEATFSRRPVRIKSVAALPDISTGEPSEFLWVGRLTPYKRPEQFLDLAEALPEAQFAMVAVPSGGFGLELAPALRERADGLPNLRWLDPRPRAELLELMRSAVAIVNTAEYEGMPNLFLEGWALGVPALCLHHDPDGVIARERVGLFAAGDAAAFAAGARTLWTDVALRDELGAAGRRYVEREHREDVVLQRWEAALGLSAGATPRDVAMSAT